MPNIDKIINNHNLKLMNPTPPGQNSNNTNNNNNCNCRLTNQCPMENKCVIENVVYKATIFSKLNPSDYKIYFGTAMGLWKERYYNHKTSFKLEAHKNDTALSQYYWEIKKYDPNPTVLWSVVSRASPPKSLSEKCQLCLLEILNIILNDKNDRVLNRRTQLISKCRHTSGYLLTRPSPRPEPPPIN